MRIFLTSDIGASKKVNGVIRVATPMNNTNGFVNNLRQQLRGNRRFVFMPSKFDGALTESYFNLTVQSFKMSGIEFEEYILVNQKSISDLKQIIDGSDLVFLSGGNTRAQRQLFEQIKLDSILRNYNGVIVGQSAGAVNLADVVYCSPEAESEMENPHHRFFRGMGFTSVSIEPHFGNSQGFGSINLIKDILLPDSHKRAFVAITDGSYIFDDGKTKTVYGEAYLFKGGEYKKICENMKTANLTL